MLFAHLLQLTTMYSLQHTTTLPSSCQICGTKLHDATPNQVRTSAIKYVKTAECWLYLAIHINPFSRRGDSTEANLGDVA
jgi:hypothetical protein